ncbi:MAG: mercury resistance protein [Nitrospinota bacterium]|nr:mercury resistance protein [Nitrospinota bacterium]MDP7385897.1 mercury resistance protein [Nitrospinota bacterium]HJM43254.1 mercury resistance protein [Nitrospinota bacterium]
MKPQRSITGKFMLGAAFFLCPCHLPIYLALLGGTAAGALLSENAYTAGTVLALAFLAALILGLRLSGKRMQRTESASRRDPSAASSLSR